MLFIHISWDFFFFTSFFPTFITVAHQKMTYSLISRRYIFPRTCMHTRRTLSEPSAVHCQREKVVVTDAVVAFQTFVHPRLICIMPLPCQGAVLKGVAIPFVFYFVTPILYLRHLFEEYVVRYFVYFFSPPFFCTYIVTCFHDIDNVIYTKTQINGWAYWHFHFFRLLLTFFPFTSSYMSWLVTSH